MNPSAQVQDLLQTIDEAQRRFEQIEPSLQAFLPEEGRFDRLRGEARDLLERYPSQEDRPPLFGVPVGVKDIYHVDGFATRAGSRLPLEALQGAEAESVKRLKASGALVLGKTVTTEFAYFSPGPTRNPHNPAHTPGGSSSGSAAAVAAGLCPLALGTQTIGSLMRPASFCGVIALKPSYARIPAQGIIPLAPALDHAGFFAADLDLAEKAAACLYEDWRGVPENPGRPVLGIPQGPYLEGAGSEALERFEAARAALEAAGYVIRRAPVMPDFAEIRKRHRTILAAQAAAVHAAWFDRYESLYAAKTAELIRQGRQVSMPELDVALKAKGQFHEQLEGSMVLHGIGLWMAPSAPGAAPRGLESTGDPVMNLPWTQAGLPSLSLPCGRNGAGLPLGMQLVGRLNADESLLAWSREIQLVVEGL